MPAEIKSDEQLYKEAREGGQLRHLPKEVWVAYAAGILYTAQTEEELIQEIPEETGCFFGQPNMPDEELQVYSIRGPRLASNKHH